ncbi:MAG TPA: hypothetical protein VH539_20475 [Gemmatimonadaceae bacterium]|jgi:hypothetical protein
MKSYDREPLDWSFTYRVRDARVTLGAPSTVATDTGALGLWTTWRQGRTYAIRCRINLSEEWFAAALLASLDTDPPKVRA